MRPLLVLLFVACHAPRSTRDDAAPAPPSAAVAAPEASAPVASAPLRTQGAWGIAVRGGAVPARPIVFFHGMGATPEDSCSYFEEAARPRGVLVCPRGHGAHALDDALSRAGELGAIADNGVLLGFSVGARLALERALAEKGRWRGLFLSSMPLSLDAASLRAAGVRGVVLAAGGLDGSRAQLEAQAKQLARAGYPARFVSLGDRVGHHFGPDMPAIAREALDWLDSLDAPSSR